MFLSGTHVMIDIETLSTRSNARVLQAAAVVFNSEGIMHTHSWLLDQTQQQSRHMDVKTLMFWLQTNSNRLHDLLQGETRVDEFAYDIEKLGQAHEPTGWWAHSPSFDLVILEDLLRQVRTPTPWSHRNAFDTRTLSLVKGVKMKRTAEADQHDALSDAIAQAKWVIEVARM